MQADGPGVESAIGRCDPHVENIAFAIESHGHVDAGRAKRPDAAEEISKIGDLDSRHGEDHIAFTEAGAARGTIAGETDDDDASVRFSRVKAEPRPGRPIHPS